MALPLQAGLTPMEVAFLCEMEMVTVVPRQRLESLNLLSVRFPALLYPINFISRDSTNILFPGPNTVSPPSSPISPTLVACPPTQTPTTGEYPPSALAPPLLPRKNPQTRDRDLSPRLLSSTSTPSPNNITNIAHRLCVSALPPLLNCRCTA
jgi:hypothetical protein